MISPLLPDQCGHVYHSLWQTNPLAQIQVVSLKLFIRDLYQTDIPDGTFPKFTGFILHIHLGIWRDDALFCGEPRYAPRRSQTFTKASWE